MEQQKNESKVHKKTCSFMSKEAQNLLPLHFDVVEDCRPLADGLWRQRDLDIFPTEVVHVHQVVVLDCQAHVVFLTLQCPQKETSVS